MAKAYTIVTVTVACMKTTLIEPLKQPFKSTWEMVALASPEPFPGTQETRTGFGISVRV